MLHLTRKGEWVYPDEMGKIANGLIHGPKLEVTQGKMEKMSKY
jgi:hypothetical protein